MLINLNRVYSAGIWTHNLLFHDSPPITTRPVLPPNYLNKFTRNSCRKDFQKCWNHLRYFLSTQIRQILFFWSNLRQLRNYLPLSRVEKGGNRDIENERTKWKKAKQSIEFHPLWSENHHLPFTSKYKWSSKYKLLILPLQPSLSSAHLIIEIKIGGRPGLLVMAGFVAQRFWQETHVQEIMSLNPSTGT